MIPILILPPLLRAFTSAFLLLFLSFDFDQSTHYFVPIIIQNTHRTFLILHLYKCKPLFKFNFYYLPTTFKQRFDIRFFVVIWQIANVECINNATAEFLTQVFDSGIR